MTHARRVLRKWTIVLPPAAMLLLLLATASPALAASPKRCQDVTATGGAFVAQNVRAKSISCSTLRTKLRTWARRGSESLPNSKRGWKCRRVAGRWKCTKRGSASSATFTLSREKVAPTITLAAPSQGAHYGAGASVTVAYVCTDNVKIAKCVGTAPSGSKLPTSQPGSHSFTVTATDTAGNKATRTVTYTVADATPPADTTAPTITLGTPEDGAKYTFGTSVRAEYTCTDNRALASCDGTVARGALIPTDVIGKHAFSVTAKDAAGNVAAKQITYTVTDPKPPTVTVNGLAAAESFTWNQARTVNYSCDDDVAIDTCTASVGTTDVKSGTAVPTSGAPGPGTRTLKVVATDKSGNVTTKEVQYTVQNAGYYALTYDDGPNTDYTAGVLDALKTAGAHGTFFLLGSQIQASADHLALAKRVVSEGNWVGNHTMTHTNVGPDDPEGTCALVFGDPNWTPCHYNNAANQHIGDTDADINTKEVVAASTLIQQQLGVTPQFFRPPYGSYNQAVMDYVRTDGMELANWTLDTNDWEPTTTVDQVVTAAMGVSSGGIILMHDSNAFAAPATTRIVTRLRDEKGMLPGKLAANLAHQQFITGWEDAGGNLGFYVEAVAP